MRSDSHLDKLFRKPRFSLYHPAMSDENVRRLYQLKLEKGRPMTRLLDEILNEYFEQHIPTESREGGINECMSVKSAGTHSKSNRPKREGIVMTSDSGTVPSAEPSMTR